MRTASSSATACRSGKHPRCSSTSPRWTSPGPAPGFFPGMKKGDPRAACFHAPALPAGSAVLRITPQNLVHPLGGIHPLRLVARLVPHIEHHTRTDRQHTNDHRDRRQKGIHRTPLLHKRQPAGGVAPPNGAILRRAKGSVNGKRKRHSPLIIRPSHESVRPLSPQSSRHRYLQPAQGEPRKHRPTHGADQTQRQITHHNPQRDLLPQPGMGITVVNNRLHGMNTPLSTDFIKTVRYGLPR